MKNLFIGLFLFFLISGVAFGANTVVRNGNVIEISDIDSDWSWSDTFPQYPQMPVVSIQFNGAAADDQCVIKNATDTGPALFDVLVVDEYDQRYKLFNGTLLKPVLDYSAGTYTAGSTVILILDF